MTKEQIECLRSEAAKSGMRTDRQIAESIGMDKATFSTKINGKRVFSLAEIEALRRSLSLSDKKVVFLFFESSQQK